MTERKRLEDFNDYKQQDKNIILGEKLALEGIFNTLVVRLAQQKRPDFVPPPGSSLQEFEQQLRDIEELEKERSVALHAEVNRQFRLQKTDEERHLVPMSSITQ